MMPVRPAVKRLAPRAQRNNNPGNLRTLSQGAKWPGQTGIDNNTGGPFAIFDSATSGFAALSALLLTYEDAHNLRTIDAIFDRYAPPVENNTVAYKQQIAKALGVSTTAQLDMHVEFRLLAITTAIGHYEAGIVWWNPLDQRAGILAALTKVGVAV